MAKARSETILLLGNPERKEYRASEAIKPGYLVQFGGTQQIQKQATEGQNCRRAWAQENVNLGESIEDAYAVKDNVHVVICSAGHEVQARVAASAAAIALWDELMASGDGTVEKKTGTHTVIGYALEAVDNSSNAAGEAWINMEVK